jgi:hypothetical protein
MNQVCCSEIWVYGCKDAAGCRVKLGIPWNCAVRWFAEGTVHSNGLTILPAIFLWIYEQPSCTNQNTGIKIVSSLYRTNLNHFIERTNKYLAISFPLRPFNIACLNYSIHQFIGCNNIDHDLYHKGGQVFSAFVNHVIGFCAYVFDELRDHYIF